MKIELIGQVQKIEQWLKNDTRKDVFIREQTSQDEIIIMCPLEKFPLLKKCKRNKKLKFFVDLKKLYVGSYARNYLILEQVIALK